MMGKQLYYFPLGINPRQNPQCGQLGAGGGRRLGRVTVGGSRDKGGGVGCDGVGEGHGGMAGGEGQVVGSRGFGHHMHATRITLPACLPP